MTPAFASFLVALAVRTTLVLIVVSVGLRLLGKREIGDLNLLDVVLVLTLANAVQNAMTAGKGDLTVGIVSAGTLLGVGRLLSTLYSRFPRAEERLSGDAALLVSNGHVLRGALRREGVTDDELMAALRQHGLSEPSQARLVVLERNGEMSVLPKERGEGSQ